MTAKADAAWSKQNNRSLMDIPVSQVIFSLGYLLLEFHVKKNQLCEKTTVLWMPVICNQIWPRQVGLVFVNNSNLLPNAQVWLINL